MDPNDKVYAFAEGSYQTLDNSNVLVGYGIRPVVKEFATDSTDGEVLWSAQFGYVNNNNTVQAYRAYKQDWHATPSTELSLVVGDAENDESLFSCASSSSKRGYVSWNGATDISTYSIYIGSNSKSDSMQLMAKVPNRGFETEFVVPADAKSVQVKAIVGSEEVGKSNIVKV